MADEFAIIQQYFYRQPGEQVMLGIGDDAAMIAPLASPLLVCTDTLVQGRHFPENETPENIAYKALAVNISDMAAMGAVSQFFTLNLTLPDVDVDWLQRFSQSLFTLAQLHDLQLIGGDTTRGPLSVSITLLARAGEKTLRRDAAQVGDSIYVTNTLGDAALGLLFLQGQWELASQWQPSCLQALQQPQAQTQLVALCGRWINACIDISDGLLADLGHICQQSVCGARLALEQIPLSAAQQDYVSQTGDWSKALAWGDDYQLCFTVSPQHEAQLLDCAKKQNLMISRIGEISNNDRVIVLDKYGEEQLLVHKGFNHFHD